MRLLLLAVLLAASCSLIPTPSAPASPLGKAPTTSQSLVDAAPAAIEAVSGFVEMMIITGLIASLVFRQVRLAVAAMLVAFYNRIESFFRGSSQPPSS